MYYKPNPMNTSDVELPEGITDVVEILAQQVHEIWAKEKIKEGYTYGKSLDPVKLTHPSLIPYQDLPDTQKNYDRNTLLETIRLLIKLGYHIERK